MTRSDHGAKRGPYICQVCGETGHNAQYHNGTSRSKQAARWLAEQTGNVGYTDAGTRFDITREAVRLAWQQLALGETPREHFRRHESAAIVDLARAGKTLRQIADELGAAATTIWKTCKKARVLLKDGRVDRVDSDALAAGLDIVRAGGSIAEGGSVAGIQYASFQRYVKRAKITPAPFDQGKRGLGRSSQAALLVQQEGVSPGEAAKLFEVSPGSVRSYLRRYAA